MGARGWTTSRNGATTSILSMYAGTADRRDRRRWHCRRSRTSQLFERIQRSATSAQPWTSSSSDAVCRSSARSEEHTSELQSQSNLVCRLLLEKKKLSQLKTIRSHIGLHNRGS